MTRGRRAAAGLLGGVVVAAAVASLSARAGPAVPGTGRFAYVQTLDGGYSYRLFVANDAGGGRRRVTAHRAVGRPSFSPNGKRIAFAAPRGDDSTARYAIYAVNIDGSRLRRLTSPRFADFDPAWSPDGRFIAFSRDRRGNLRSSCCAIGVMRADGTRERIVPRSNGGTHPSWSPDGRRLAFQAPAGLRVIRRDGSGRRLLVRGRVSDPAWSPDGRHIAFVQLVSGDHSRIAVVPSGDGRVKIRVDRPGQVETPAWAADSRAISFTAYRGQGDDGRRASSVWRSAGPGVDPTRLFDPSNEVYGLAYSSRIPSSRDLPLTGDWNADDRTTAGLARRIDGRYEWRLTNRPSGGTTARRFRFGSPPWVPLTGDWDGNGSTNAGIVQPVDGRLRWRVRLPGRLRTFRYGLANRYDIPVAGDWDGNGTTTAGFVRPVDGRLRWFVSNRASNPTTSRRFTYGRVGTYDIPVVGDWDGNGTVTAGVVRPVDGRLQWHLTNRIADPTTARRFLYGRVAAHDVPVVGDWNGDGTDTVGVVRPVDGRLRWLVSDQVASPSVTRRFEYGRG